MKQVMKQGLQYQQIPAGFSAGDQRRDQAGSSHGFQTANQMLIDLYDTTGFNKGKAKVSNEHQSTTSTLGDNFPSNVAKDKAPDKNDHIMDDDYISNFGGDNVIVVNSQSNNANMADVTTSLHNTKRVRTNKNVSGRWVSTNPNSPSEDL